MADTRPMGVIAAIEAERDAALRQADLWREQHAAAIRERDAALARLAAAREAWAAEVEAERAAAVRRMEWALTLVYRLAPCPVARVCDEALDRSGALLGRIRDRARGEPAAALSPDAPAPDDPTHGVMFGGEGASRLAGPDDAPAPDAPPDLGGVRPREILVKIFVDANDGVLKAKVRCVTRVPLGGGLRKWYLSRDGRWVFVPGCANIPGECLLDVAVKTETPGSLFTNGTSDISVGWVRGLPREEDGEGAK